MCKWARIVGLTMVKSVCTGRPSMASNSIGCSRKQRVIVGRGMCITIGLRTCGMAMPSPMPVEPSDSRAINTWNRNERSTSSGKGITSTTA